MSRHFALPDPVDTSASEILITEQLVEAKPQPRGVISSVLACGNLDLFGCGPRVSLALNIAISLEPDLQRGKCKPLPLRSYGQIPINEALEARADLDKGSVLDEVVRNETRRHIDELVKQGRLRFTSESHAKLFSRMLEGLLTSLNTSRTTPDEAITLTKMIIEQAQDAIRR